MVQKLESDRLDLLCGWRKNRQDSLDRTLPSRIANWLIGRVTGVALHDYGCSLKVGRRDVLEGLDLRGEMHRFIPLWVANLTHPSRIAEIPVNHRARSAGFPSTEFPVPRESYLICWLRGFSSDSKSVLDIFWGRWSGHWFSWWVSPYLSVYSKIVGGRYRGRPLLITGVLLALVGLQLITTGLIAEMLTRLRSRRQPLLTKKLIRWFG